MNEPTQLPAQPQPGQPGHPAQLPAKPQGDFVVAGWPGGLFEITGSDFGSSKGTVAVRANEEVTVPAGDAVFVVYDVGPTRQAAK